MENKFMQLLTGEFTGDEFHLPLKSIVPVLIAYPELIIKTNSEVPDITGMPSPKSEGFSLKDVVPYYNSSYDYNSDEGNIYLPDLPNPNRLINIFTKLFEEIVNGVSSGQSNLERLPKVILVIDIASNKRDFGVVSPTGDDIKKFGDKSIAMFTLKGYRAANSGVDQSETQKHNILLIDTLTRRFNNKGIGGIK